MASRSVPAGRFLAGRFPAARLLAARLLAIAALGASLGGCETLQQILPEQQQAAPDQSALLIGQLWIADRMGGQPVGAEPRVTLAFYADGRLVGKGGCNTYFGRYRLDGSALQISALKAGSAACDAAVTAQEQAYLAELGSAARYEIQPDPLQPGGSLLLIAADGSDIHFQRDTAQSVQLLDYACDGGAALRVIFDWAGGTASLTPEGGGAARLNKVPVATGFRFENGEQSFAGQGSDAQWSNGGAVPVACRVAS